MSGWRRKAATGLAAVVLTWLTAVAIATGWTVIGGRAVERAMAGLEDGDER